MRLLILMLAFALFTGVSTYDMMKKRARWRWDEPMKEATRYHRLETRNSIPLYFPAQE
ncbi:hypothetical protein JCM12178A_13240 [Salidesulfovibrio brasiliensis]